MSRTQSSSPRSEYFSAKPTSWLVASLVAEALRETGGSGSDHLRLTHGMGNGLIETWRYSPGWSSLDTRPSTVSSAGDRESSDIYA